MARKRKDEFVEDGSYESMALTKLKSLLEDRDINPKGNKEDLIKTLQMDDEGKFIRETLYEKADNGFMVGIDTRNTKQLIEVGKMVEKKEAQNLNMFSNNRVHYWTPQKLAS